MYIFTPVISDGTYTLAEDVRLPKITVMVANPEIMLAEEDLSDVSGSKTPMCGVISSNTTWEEEGTLRDGELIIKPGATLTINGVVHLQGIVTIKGGGTILRGSGDAYITADSSSNVTMSNITVDGKSIAARFSIIRADSVDNLVLNDGCVIQNCITSGYAGGGAISAFLRDGSQ